MAHPALAHPQRLRELSYQALAGRTLRRTARRVLASVTEPRIAVLARCDDVLATWLAGFPGVRVVGLEPGLTRWERQGRLAGAGPLDLLVDDGENGDGVIDRFVESFRHLRKGGTYVLTARSPHAGERLHQFLHDLRAGHEVPVAAADRQSLARAVREIGRDRGQLTVTRRGRTLAKLRENEMNEALAVDASRGRILATVPAAEFDSRCEMRASGRARKDRTKERYEAPTLYLREYFDVSCRLKSVVIQRGLLCPDTYRHHLNTNLTHKSLKDAGRQYVVAPRNQPPARRLEGTYFHLDNEIRGFFGHALTEQVSRLWGWQQARERYPDVKALLSINRGREVAEWELTLLEAGGIDRSDVEVIREPVRVERLLSATPMFSMPAYVHPRIIETWDAVGAALRGQASDRAYPSRIFCSRQDDRRPCVNRDEVESLFVAHGFQVVFPEELPLPDQVAMFHQADVIAGYAGSALFTTLFSDRRKHLVVITPDTYGPSNEYMISAVRGHRLDVVVGISESTVGKESLRAPFVVDPATDGRWLTEVLDGL